MTIHISRSGIQHDDDGFMSVLCQCGMTIGVAPDAETMLDMAMEHAWAGGVADARAAVQEGRT